MTVLLIVYIFSWIAIDSTAVSIFVDILVELTNTVFVFVNSTNVTTNIETAALSNVNLPFVRTSDLNSPEIKNPLPAGLWSYVKGKGINSCPEKGSFFVRGWLMISKVGF